MLREIAFSGHGDINIGCSLGSTVTLQQKYFMTQLTSESVAGCSSLLEPLTIEGQGA